MIMIPPPLLTISWHEPLAPAASGFQRKADGGLLTAECFTNFTSFTTGPRSSLNPRTYCGANADSCSLHAASGTSTVKTPSAKPAARARPATSFPHTTGQASATASSAGRDRKRSAMMLRKPVRTGSTVLLRSKADSNIRLGWWSAQLGSRLASKAVPPDELVTL